MSNGYFNFKRFTVKQERASMKVGTDGVLVGAWASLSTCPQRILDVGTGTGLIALMLAQRSEDWNARIDAVEIEPESAEQARGNSQNSDWNNRIAIYNEDFLLFGAKHPQSFDLVVSNPPYFNDALLSPDSGRTLARHTQLLSYESLMNGVAAVLKPTGSCVVIVPASEEGRLFKAAFVNGLYPCRKDYVKTIAHLEPKRVLVEFVLSETACSCGEIVIEQSKGIYSDYYMELTRDFYLKF